MASSKKKSSPVQVSIRASNGFEYSFDSGVELQSAAYRWTYVLRNRNRWHNNVDYRRELEEKCYRQLIEFGLTPAQLQELAECQMLEVSIPYPDEDAGWEARILPWEFLICEGTRKAGRRRSVAIVRHLERKGRIPKIKNLPNQVAFITGAAEALSPYTDFSGQRNLVYQRVFQQPGSSKTDPRLQNVFDPDLDQLRSVISTTMPEIVHVAGVDNHQAQTQLRLLDASGEFNDGMVLRTKVGKQLVPGAVSAMDLAEALNAGATKPAIVFFNLQNSAARTAALAVARGAGAAIGFQDHIDRQIAENFIGDFYDALRGGYTTEIQETWNVHAAFLAAFALLKKSGANLKGSGIVLWSAESISKRSDGGENLRNEADEIAQSIEREDLKRMDFESVSGTGDGGIDENLTIEVKAKERLNFSLLHNRQPIFEKFEIRKNRGEMKSVRVEVELQIGSERPKFTRVLNLNSSLTRLEKEIFIPLTWMRTELFWESVLISAQVDITWQNQTLYSSSHPIVMDPADDWVDTDENRQSLPCFVYPRDPAVAQIICGAQEFLFGIADDYSAGFDGYQSIDLAADDPYERVDQQVRAIWTSLIRNHKLGYINPPPTFTEYSQRIRTPEEVIQGGRGTCIDLTMLLASCLEYVEIYPVIFLLEGHAFPGYWRSDVDHENFILPTDFVSEEKSPSVWQASPWMVGKNSYDEVLQQIHDGNIVPLESVWLTQSAGFWDAVEQGWENMRIAEEFDSLIDVRFARNNDVTPLPIRSLRE